MVGDYNGDFALLHSKKLYVMWKTSNYTTLGNSNMTVYVNENGDFLQLLYNGDYA